MHKLQVNNLSVSFGGPSARDSTRAIDSIELSVADGEFVCILGPSGGGKSTLLNAIAGLLADKPAAHVGGAISIDGERTHGINPKMGYVFQSDTLLPWRTILENVLLPLRIRARQVALKRSKAELITHAQTLLDRVGLSKFSMHYPAQLSGGMRKRVQLAQLIAQNPEIFLMDEPFGSLDAQTRVVMQLEFLKLWELERKTVLFVTHDLNESILLADRIVCLTSRPARIKASYTVNIPRPRSLEKLTADPSYPGLFQQLWRDVSETLEDQS